MARKQRKHVSLDEPTINALDFLKRKLGDSHSLTIRKAVKRLCAEYRERGDEVIPDAGLTVADLVSNDRADGREGGDEQPTGSDQSDGSVDGVSFDPGGGAGGASEPSDVDGEEAEEGTRTDRGSSSEEGDSVRKEEGDRPQGGDEGEGSDSWTNWGL